MAPHGSGTQPEVAVHLPHTAIHPTFENTWGVQLLAVMISTGLWGVAIATILTYFIVGSKHDAMTVKLAVCALALLGTVDTFVANHVVYSFFVTFRGNPHRLTNIPVCKSARVACVFFTAFICQLFYARRIWLVGRFLKSRFRYAVYPIVILACTQLAGGLLQVWALATRRTYMELGAKRWMLISMHIHGWSSSLCDILISVALVAILRSTSEGLSRRTKRTVLRIIVFTVNRAILTSACAVLTISLYAFLSGPFYFHIPLFAGTHIYVISVVAMLLSREGFRDDLKGTQVGLSEFEARLPPDSMNLSVVTSTTELGMGQDHHKG